jgi:hypothetical protein
MLPFLERRLTYPPQDQRRQFMDIDTVLAR